MALATALTREKSSADAYRIASTGLTRYARYNALITPRPPSEESRARSRRKSSTGLRRSPTTTLERRRGRHALMALATALTRERSSADAYRIASTGLRGAVERHAPSLDDVAEGLPDGGSHSEATPRAAHARRSAAAHVEGNLPAMRHHPNHDCIMIAS